MVKLSGIGRERKKELFQLNEQIFKVRSVRNNSNMDNTVARTHFSSLKLKTSCNSDVCFSASLTIPTGKCCHRDYARYCCSDIPVCADGGNVTVEKVVFKIDPCSTPWNLSACMLGYYSTNGSNILPCPEGIEQRVFLISLH